MGGRGSKAVVSSLRCLVPEFITLGHLQVMFLESHSWEVTLPGLEFSWAGGAGRESCHNTGQVQWLHSGLTLGGGLGGSVAPKGA